MENKTDRALEQFNQGFSCAQAVLSAFGVQYGLDVDQSLRVAGAFGGGMARMGETCGAVTGAFMVIGLLYGKTLPEDDAAKEKTYRVVHQFVDQFKAQNGSILCRDLLGCDLSTPTGSEKAREANLFKTLCPLYVRNSADILRSLIEEGQA
jgi:C_GCAxxG_C_C family probable redox protein